MSRVKSDNFGGLNHSSGTGFMLCEIFFVFFCRLLSKSYWVRFAMKSLISSLSFITISELK